VRCRTYRPSRGRRGPAVWRCWCCSFGNDILWPLFLQRAGPGFAPSPISGRDHLRAGRRDYDCAADHPDGAACRLRGGGRLAAG
jgi:hypothetical protein